MLEVLTNTNKSQQLYKRACELIPGGVNSPVRSFKAVELEPLFISKAKGQYIWDIDQNRYIDYVCSWGALINGHIPSQVIEAVEAAVLKGTSFGAPHENEIELAEIITSHMPAIEKIRLVNSGTEAVMTAIRLARAYTKRNKIIKFSGCYHGHADVVLSNGGSGMAILGLPACPGVTKNTANETITLPFNNIPAFEISFSKFPREIAAVIVEPVIGNCGVIPPEAGYLKHIREITKKYNSLLIFDEVITGFRLSLGGAQELYKIKPDLTTLGKIIGGGLPMGAVGGKKEIMDLLSPVGPVYQAGTLSGNPISVACGIATLQLLKKETYEYLEKISLQLTTGIEKIKLETGNKFQINRVGSMFSIFFTKNKVYDQKSATKSNTKMFAEFFKYVLSSGIYLACSQFEANFLSTSHKEEDIKKTIEAINLAIEKLQITNNL